MKKFRVVYVNGYKVVCLFSLHVCCVKKIDVSFVFLYFEIAFVVVENKGMFLTNFAIFFGLNEFLVS